MDTFTIGTQIEKELNSFFTSKVRLATLSKQDDSVRLLKKNPDGYYYNQHETIQLIDLYWNSRFEGSSKDKLGHRKMFINKGKFRTEVSAKQIDIDVSNFRFIPDDYADPWTAHFMQKDFTEWSKDTYFGELLNQCVDNFPKYGTVVLKHVGRELKFVPLQLLRCDQTAESLKTARYVIEEHPDMYLWEMQIMKGWNMEGFTLKYDECATVYERYGYLPLSLLKKLKNEKPEAGDENIFVDTLVIAAKQKKTGVDPNAHEGWHIFFAEEVKDRPYEEAHWSKQHGRWLGVGVMEDQIEPQRGTNIVINLLRRSLQWSSKRIAQSASTSVAAKNLAMDVADGTILDVGQGGAITPVDLSNKSNGEFQQFMQEWEKNGDQVSFTYEIATGESMPSGTPFRLGVVLSNAVTSYFGLKKEKLGLFLKRAVMVGLVPEFIKDMSKKDRVVMMFSGEAGFEALKDATMQMVRGEASRIMLLSGQEVDVDGLQAIVSPFASATSLPFNISKDAYKTAKYKFTLTVTGEEIDLNTKIETLKSLHQVLAAQGDPRANKVLDRIAALAGENMATFGSSTEPGPALPPGGPTAPVEAGAAPSKSTNAGAQPSESTY